jgi:hypothetical protein
MEPVCTIAPPRPTSFMAFAAAWAAKNLPLRITSTKRSYSTSSISRNGFGVNMPALLNSTSSRPNRSIAVFTTASPVAGNAISPTCTTARVPFGSISRGRLGLRAITAINDNRAALGDEPRRDLFADPRGSAGDDSSLILETHCCSLYGFEWNQPASCRQEMITQQFVEDVGSLLGEEDSRSLQLHGWLCSGNHIGQPVRPLHREVDVIRAPNDQGWRL